MMALHKSAIASILIAGLCVLGGLRCTPSVLPEALRKGQRLERQGKLEQALSVYTQVWKNGQKKRHRTLGGMRRAGILARLHRNVAAVKTYLAVAEQTGGRTRPAARRAARALFRAGRLYLEKMNQTARGLALWRKVMVAYPDTVAAEDALKFWVRHHRRHARAVDLVTTLWQYFKAVRHRALADNLLWKIARVYERDLGNLKSAVEVFDGLGKHKPKSNLADDANFRAAALYRKLGQPMKALLCYARILQTKTRSWVMASFNSPFLDDARLQHALTWLEDLRKPERAIASLRRLADDHQTSILRDDALWWMALAHLRLGQRARALAVHAELTKRFPKSRFVRQKKELQDWAPVAAALRKRNRAGVCRALARHAQNHRFGWFRKRRKHLQQQHKCEAVDMQDGKQTRSH